MSMKAAPYTGGLATACQQATFGVNQTDVLDESYRKAGKMDLTKFATRLDIVTSGLLDTITPNILDGHNSDKVLRAEMYKLNVYGSFAAYRCHHGWALSSKRTRVLPTAHKGGALSLSHDNKEWVFDSAAELAKLSVTAGPAIAYVAFYSDVTHAVEPVLEGYRVTLTYNLFLANRPEAAGGHRIIQGLVQKLEDTLLVLLADPAFLPTGGLLAFGLAHKYPMLNLSHNAHPNALGLGPVLRMLKGSDARLRIAVEHVRLVTQVKFVARAK
ncbi:hypothetical protein B0H19DRAFT_1209372 [Mycena capillaripes]|nr:hypothetical protein B0H19DRAFT_1209372 [Mycena capillaripes]